MSAMMLMCIADCGKAQVSSLDVFLAAMERHGGVRLTGQLIRTNATYAKGLWELEWPNRETIVQGGTDLNEFMTTKSGHYNGNFRTRPVGTNALTLEQAVKRSRDFIAELGFGLPECFGDLDPKNAKDPNSDDDYFLLIWYEPGYDDLRSFEIEWARKSAQIISCSLPPFRPKKTYTPTNPPQEGSWEHHLATSPRDFRAIKAFAPILPELRPVLEILKTNAFDTPEAKEPFKPGFTRSIRTLDDWKFWLDSGKLGGFATPDRLFRNPDAGQWTHTMKRTSKLGESDAIQRVVAAIRKLGRKDIADWCEVNRPKVFQPNTHGSTHLSRLWFEWDTPESAKQPVAVRAEVDTASGELKYLRFGMEPIDEPSTAK